MAVHLLTLAELKEKLKNTEDKIIVIDFFAIWCAPCRMIAPLYEKLAEENTDILFLKIDIDSESEIAEEFDIASLPTFIIFKNGVALKKFSGGNIKKVEEMILECKS